MKNFKLTNGLRGEFIRMIQSMDLTKPKRVDVTDWRKKRSLAANAQVWVWLPQISDVIAEDIKSTRRIIKLDFGLPIVLACPQIGQRYGERLQRIGFFNWNREQQLEEMDYTPVTSLMDTKQHSQLRDNVMYFYNQLGANIGYQES